MTKNDSLVFYNDCDITEVLNERLSLHTLEAGEHGYGKPDWFYF